MSDDDKFSERMRDVRPLSGPRQRPRPKPRSPTASAGDERKTAELIRPDPEEPLLARSPDLSQAELRRLSQGEIRPEARVDLHRLREDSASDRFRQALANSETAGERCLLVIHGRGLHSGDAALREALPGWLDSVASRILASAPSTARDGGAGATYVWLRRRS